MTWFPELVISRQSLTGGGQDENDGLRARALETSQIFTHSIIKCYLFDRLQLKAGRGLGAVLGREVVEW